MRRAVQVAPSLSAGDPGQTWDPKRAELGKRLQSPFLAVVYANSDLYSKVDPGADTMISSIDEIGASMMKCGLPTSIILDIVKNNVAAYAESEAAAEYKKDKSKQEWKNHLENFLDIRFDLLRMAHYGIRSNDKDMPTLATHLEHLLKHAEEYKGKSVVYSHKLHERAHSKVNGATFLPMALFVEVFGQTDPNDKAQKSFVTAEDLRRLFLECKYPKGWVPHKVTKKQFNIEENAGKTVEGPQSSANGAAKKETAKAKDDSSSKGGCVIL